MRDLLNSRAGDEHFVVEVETDGAAYLRFGDGRFGSRPTPTSDSWRATASAMGRAATSARRRWRTSSAATRTSPIRSSPA